jgi:C1A family cysteine protease
MVACVVATALAANTRPAEFYEKEFFQHMVNFSLKFKNGAEFIRRLGIFADNLDSFDKHNADETQTYKVGINQFTHLSFDEFVSTVHIGGTRTPNLRKNPKGLEHIPKPRSSLPDTVDWTTAGAVTAVKNQGNCGSCWSFSATGALEGAYQIKTGSLQSFSEQQLVSCDTDGGDAGCDGGWMDDAFDFVQASKGICLETDYPYISGTTGKSGNCVSSCTAVADSAPTSYTDVKAGSVDDLMSAVSQQPVAIAIQANQLAFQSYKSGVLTGRCGQRLDHGVLAVGYGSLDGVDYWKVKNSWGAEWGQDGYILIERSDADLCGVLDAASYVNL